MQMHETKSCPDSSEVRRHQGFLVSKNLTLFDTPLFDPVRYIIVRSSYARISLYVKYHTVHTADEYFQGRARLSYAEPAPTGTC